jgi:hypothetical protein
MKKPAEFSNRFGFIVNEVGRLYGRQFDQLSREELGLSRAQRGTRAAIRRRSPSWPITWT